MNQSRITLALSLAALLGGGLFLPGLASAHDGNSIHRVEQGQLAPRGEQHGLHVQRLRYAPDNWYLLRHREASHHDYRPAKRLYRMHGKPHQRDNALPRYDVHQPSQHRAYSPVRLQIGYEIFL